jgi:hypothetical protein
MGLFPRKFQQCLTNDHPLRDAVPTYLEPLPQRHHVFLISSFVGAE